MEYILSLTDVDKSKVDLVGTKASNLGELISANFNVPIGYVLTVPAFNLFLLRNNISKNMPNKEIISDNMHFPKELEIDLLKIKDFIENNTLAVRSSALAEDLQEKSFAGMYKTILEVNGYEELKNAIMECWLSTFNLQVQRYKEASTLDSKMEISVIIQKLINAEKAGVAFSINPMTGKGNEVVISAVRGLGEKLVSGTTTPDEWIVRDNFVENKNGNNKVLTKPQLLNLAKVVKTIEKEFKTPQDIEWAIYQKELFILQTRPISIIYNETKWEVPEPGLWLRNFRLGEWLDNPTTPLFASWLLDKLDEKLYTNLEKATHIPTPTPYHIISNGWYFATGNFLPKNPLDAIWKLLRYILPALIFHPRRIAILLPPISYWGIKLYEEEWRRDILPKYLETIESCKLNVGDSSKLELFEMLEQLTNLVGHYFYSLIAVAGSAWKPEFRFAKFYEKNISPFIEDGYQVLLQGLGAATSQPYAHAVTNLDWYHPTLGEMMKEDPQTIDHSKITNKRIAIREEITTFLSDKPKLLQKFNQLLNEAQETALIREEQIFKFTLAWPLMREILNKLGNHLTSIGYLQDTNDIFFLSKDELKSIINEENSVDTNILVNRKSTWKQQCKLEPPLMLGKMSFIAKRIFDNYDQSNKIDDNDTLVMGLPVSPGIVTGKIRVIDSIENAEQFQEGEILVTKTTNPAWTILFSKAIAVITDVGSTMAHASLVAREFGIPAIVGTGNGTSILKTGQIVNVNGNTGKVREKI